MYQCSLYFTVHRVTAIHASQVVETAAVFPRLPPILQHPCCIIPPRARIGTWTRASTPYRFRIDREFYLFYGSGNLTESTVNSILFSMAVEADQNQLRVRDSFRQQWRPIRTTASLRFCFTVANTNQILLIRIRHSPHPCQVFSWLRLVAPRLVAPRLRYRAPSLLRVFRPG